MVRAAAAAAEAEPAIRVRVLRAPDAGADDVLAADGYVFATPENLAAMSGMLKDFFDRTYYPVLERVNGRPYAVLVCAGSDGSNAVRQVQRIATGWEVELRIAIDAIIPVERIYPLLERFYAAGHGTQIRLSYEVLGGTWDALATDRADLVIGAPGDMPARGGITSRLLCTRSDFVFAIAPDHPLAKWEGAIPSSEIVRYRGTVIADTSQELPARSIGLIDGQDALRVPDIRAKASAQVAGLGIGHLPRWLAAPEIAAGRLVEKEIAEPRPAMPLHLAWRSRQIGKALRWFLDALDETDTITTLTRDL